MCKMCEKRGKTWSGSDPVCGFPDSKDFDIANWNCATLNELRTIAEEKDLIQYMNDCSLAVIPVKDEGWIVLSWYKQRGRTSSARFIIDEIDQPLSLEIAEKALEYYKNI